MKRYSFCPVCGARYGHAFDDAQCAPAPIQSVLVCGSCGFQFWQNSKPTVCALVYRGGRGTRRILLARRGIEPFKGWWDLPGGFCVNGEEPVESLRREMREELGVEIRGPRLVDALLGEYVREDMAEEARFTLNLFYVCEIADDAVLRPDDDVAEAEWFPLDALPAQFAFNEKGGALAAIRAAAGG